MSHLRYWVTYIAIVIPIVILWGVYHWRWWDGLIACVGASLLAMYAAGA